MRRLVRTTALPALAILALPITAHAAAIERATEINRAAG